MTYTMSKIFSTLIIMVVVTTISVGEIVGIVTFQKTFQGFAPSTWAASIISVGTFLIAAEMIVMQKPVDIHTPTRIRAMVLTCGDVSHETGCPPSATSIALNSPICWPLGL